MTLDEAIEHAEEVAHACDDSQCAADHIQLAEWLMELRIARTEIAISKGLRNAFRAYVEKSKADNEKLRKIVEDWYPHMLKRVGPDALFQWGYIKTMVELGMDIRPLNKPEPRDGED